MGIVNEKYVEACKYSNLEAIKECFTTSNVKDILDIHVADEKKRKRVFNKIWEGIQAAIYQDRPVSVLCVFECLEKYQYADNEKLAKAILYFKPCINLHKNTHNIIFNTPFMIKYTTMAMIDSTFVSNMIRVREIIKENPQGDFTRYPLKQMLNFHADMMGFDNVKSYFSRYIKLEKPCILSDTERYGILTEHYEWFVECFGVELMRAAYKKLGDKKQTFYNFYKDNIVIKPVFCR